MATPPAATGDTGAALACATLATLRPGAVRYDLSVPVQLLHPASALQLYGALPGASFLRAAGGSCALAPGSAHSPRGALHGRGREQISTLLSRSARLGA